MIVEADIRRVQEWMGHADIATTQKAQEQSRDPRAVGLLDRQYHVAHLNLIARLGAASQPVEDEPGQGPG